MNWTRPLLAVALAGTAAAAVSATTTAATRSGFIPGTGPCTAVPQGLNLIIPHSGGVAMTNSDGYELLDVAIAGGPSMAVRGPDGTIWATATHDSVRGVHRVAPGAEALPVADGNVHLTGIGWLDGRTAAAIIDYDAEGNDDEESSGSVLADFSDGQQVDLKTAAGIEYAALSVSIGAGRLAEGANVDLGETFGYYDTSGVRLEDWANPAGNGPYNSPPYFQWPIASTASGDSGGSNLSWIEGPDWDGATNQRTGGWALVVADAVTGTESLRLDLGVPDGTLVHADYDGRFWVGTFSDSVDFQTEAQPARVVVVDTQAATPAAVDAACPPGVTATIDRLGTPAPPPIAPPPATTTPPATTAPPSAGGCDGYVPAPPAYPIRRCHEGPMVQLVQDQLVARGYDIEADGFFGLATEDAVQAFQAANGLQADGLVGPDTFAALYTGDPAASDNDGSGMIDPWEMPLDPGAGEDFVGLYVTVDDANQIIDGSGAVLTDVEFRQMIDVENPSGDQIANVMHVAGPGTDYLWFGLVHLEEGEIWLEVMQSVEIGSTDELYLRVTGDCAGADGGESIVAVAWYGPQNIAVESAWHFDPATWEVTGLDASTVVCT